MMMMMIRLLSRIKMSDISFSSAARNLGVIFDSELALKEQVNKLCQLAYLEIRRIGSLQSDSVFLRKLLKLLSRSL